MRALLLSLLGVFLAPPALAQTRPCPPVPGVERLWAEPRTRFVIVGEYHGTTETPALFGDIVCHALGTGRPVQVGLEFLESHQPALDRFMDGRDARYAPGEVFHDGRHSVAMYALLDRLRRMRAAGAPLGVFAFLRDSEAGHNQTPHESAMAAVWRERAAARPDALVLVLVGNLHARKSPAPLKLTFLPAAALLPPESTVSVIGAFTGGSAWICVGTDPKGGPACGERTAPPRSPMPPRGVRLEPSGGADGAYSVGVPFTASPPAP